MSLYLNDVGVKISLDTELDIAFATAYEIHVQRPNGQTKKWIGAFVPPGLIEYTISPGDLNLPGDYNLQAYVEGSGKKLHGDPVIITVEKHHSQI